MKKKAKVCIECNGDVEIENSNQKYCYACSQKIKREDCQEDRDIGG